MTRNSVIRKGFTLIELMAVVLILAILAGVALPKFFDYRDQARIAACKGALGGVRAGIANYYADQAINGAGPAYPTKAQLSQGNVMQGAIPENPYGTPSATVFTATKAESDARTIPVAAGADGWAYYDGGGVNDAVFYANTNDANENSF